MSATITDQTSAFMNVRQVSAYLHLNEKKIYTLVNEGKIPATKVTGKWMFPRELVDRWMLESSHGGLMTDRLIIGGGDDPLLHRVMNSFAHDCESHALVCYTPGGVRSGLDLLQSNRIDACGIHWGPGDESKIRHPALLKQYSGHSRWIMIHGFRREQGLIIDPSLTTYTDQPEALFCDRFNWVTHLTGTGTQRYFLEILNAHDSSEDKLNIIATASNEREAAAYIAMKKANVTAGTKATANEFGLAYIPFGWESYDLVLNKGIWFRYLLQDLVSRLQSSATQDVAMQLGGYDFTKSGVLLWGEE